MSDDKFKLSSLSHTDQEWLQKPQNKSYATLRGQNEVTKYTSVPQEIECFYGEKTGSRGRARNLNSIARLKLITKLNNIYMRTYLDLLSHFE